MLHNTKYWNEVVQLIKQALSEGNGLCAKWMPRKGHIAEALRIGMGMTPKQYRKTLVHLTKVVETQMCANKWNEINYEHVPSKAHQIYEICIKLRFLVLHLSLSIKAHFLILEVIRNRVFAI